MSEINMAKRRRIMQRSMALGHCVCDPKRPCPCAVFKDEGICLCAGERPNPVDDLSQVRLTELVHNAGCASKIAPADLEAILDRLPAIDDPAVLSGIPAGDDAGIYALDDGTTLVQTVDVFTPCVDDPEQFGRICAANCLSDIYAMGGVPRTALSVLCFPVETLDGRIMYHMLKGAIEVLNEAGVALIGGHSVKDDEIKLGFAITGTVEQDATEHGNAAGGDVLVLTKPLGTGVLTFARQIGRAEEATMVAVEASMASLNRAAAEAMRDVGVSATTDVTGFGLFGHLISMCRHSGVTAQIWADRLPAFPGAREALSEGIIPGAVERNREYVADDISVGDGVDAASLELGFDAQTSGGLLMAVPEAKQASLVAALGSRSVEAVVIGRIVGPSRGGILVTNAGEDAASAGSILEHTAELPEAARVSVVEGGSCCSSPAVGPTACCGEDDSCTGEASSGSDGDVQGTASESLRAFGALMRSTGADGALDARTKELITLALTVATRCRPCLKAHLVEAREMGISEAEIEEVVWCAVAMGGAPLRMFYREVCEELEGGGKTCC